jgi:hypothetical protein
VPVSPRSSLPIQPQSALDHLDRVQHLPDLNHFEPADFLRALESDLGPDSALDGAEAERLILSLAAQLDALHQVLSAIEPFSRKIMGIRLLHTLTTEPVPPQLRMLLSATILSYAADLRVLAERLERSVSVPTLDAILAAAEAVLALRHELQQGVFAIAQRLAASSLPHLREAALSPLLSTAQAARAGKAYADLQAILQSPLRLLAEPFEARIKKLQAPALEDLSAPAAEGVGAGGAAEAAPSPHGRFALLEID